MYVCKVFFGVFKVFFAQENNVWSDVLSVYSTASRVLNPGVVQCEFDRWVTGKYASRTGRPVCQIRTRLVESSFRTRIHPLAHPFRRALVVMGRQLVQIVLTSPVFPNLEPAVYATND
jgi:hypothetical protein